MLNPIKKVQSLGQSIWLDNIHRAMFLTGELQRLVNSGIMGVTSNPTIFQKAIAGSQDYDRAILHLIREELSAEEIFEVLAVEDIRAAADVLQTVYQQTKGKDGYVSLEVRPTLAYDLQGTIEEATRLFMGLERPNVMIKVPATDEGIQAFETLTAKGLNINVTLIFSIAQFEAVAMAFISGLEKRLASGQPIGTIASVASFFVSRIDTAVDLQLKSVGDHDLMGKIAIANAKVAYARFGEIFSGERWERLAGSGAHVQRPLWASTGTKNPAYPDTLYVDSLIGPDTVNTVPTATLHAFEDHGKVEPTLETGLEEAESNLKQLKVLGIDFNSVTQKLLDEGVSSFAKSYDDLILSIEDKKDRLKKDIEGVLR